MTIDEIACTRLIKLIIIVVMYITYMFNKNIKKSGNVVIYTLTAFLVLSAIYLLFDHGIDNWVIIPELKKKIEEKEEEKNATLNMDEIRNIQYEIYNIKSDIKYLETYDFKFDDKTGMMLIMGLCVLIYYFVLIALSVSVTPLINSILH